jgi:hypothetical protein
MIQEGYPTQDIIFLDKSFTGEDKANAYCELSELSFKVVEKKYDR